MEKKHILEVSITNRKSKKEKKEQMQPYLTLQISRSKYLVSITSKSLIVSWTCHFEKLKNCSYYKLPYLEHLRPHVWTGVPHVNYAIVVCTA